MNATWLKRFNTTEATSTPSADPDLNVVATPLPDDKAVRKALKKAARKKRKALKKAALIAAAKEATLEEAAAARIESLSPESTSTEAPPSPEPQGLLSVLSASMKPGRKQKPKTVPTNSRIGAHSRITPATDRHHYADHHRGVHETISQPIQILCDAMEEAKVRRVRGLPPVFLASTTEQAEIAMELFTEYYKTVNGSTGPGPVGFDTETTTGFVPRTGNGVSLIQFATDDVCLMFQVYRITRSNTRPDLFPSRLKRFLEDPEQLLVGVAAGGDAKFLKQSYGVRCAGIVNLEVLARERNVLARSLAQLDSMFGRTGREVVKTKALLGWNWDRETLESQWVWYAAKDAFSGVAIYNNMLNNNYKPGYIPYDVRYPMTEEEQEADIYEYIWRYMGGKGTSATVGILKRVIDEGYSRFHKLYQPTERAEKTDMYLRKLIVDGRLTLASGKDIADLRGPELDIDEKVRIPGRQLAVMLTTPEGVAVLSPYFNNRTVDVSTIRKRGVSIPEIEYPLERGDQDMIDLRQFLDIAWMWNRPRRLPHLASTYTTLWNAAADRIKRNYDVEVDKFFKLTAEGMDAKDENEAVTKKTVCMLYWNGLVDRLVARGVLRREESIWMVNPEIEAKCLAAVPEGAEKHNSTPLPSSHHTSGRMPDDEDENDAVVSKDTAEDDNKPIASVSDPSSSDNDAPKEVEVKQVEVESVTEEDKVKTD